MKVLFVSSGNNESFDIVPFIKEQGESLKRQGIEVGYYPIYGKGIKGYVRAGLQLRKFLKKNQYDLVHAHFIFSGWAAIIGTRKVPIILSLMGSDAYGKYIGVNKVRFSSRFLTILTWLAQPFVRAIISKSHNIERFVYLKHKSFIIPNGVNDEKFKPTENGSIQKRHKKILFLGSKSNVRKNYALAQAAIKELEIPGVEFINPYPVSHHEIPDLLNTANVLLVPSLMEGSPNIVKEAMACNCPIVATDTGDIRWVLGDTDGCYVSSFDIKNFAENVRTALEFSDVKGRTNGAQRIKELGLDSATIAGKIIEIYKRVLSAS